MLLDKNSQGGGWGMKVDLLCISDAYCSEYFGEDKCYERPGWVQSLVFLKDRHSGFAGIFCDVRLIQHMLLTLPAREG